jgi:hypothetical protein
MTMKLCSCRVIRHSPVIVSISVNRVGIRYSGTRFTDIRHEFDMYVQRSHYTYGVSVAEHTQVMIVVPDKG